jgi:hypothetical protein
MKAICAWMVVAVGLTGCAGPAAFRPADAGMTPVAVETVPATVTLVNSELRFVVIDFGDTRMPGIGTTVELYRGGAKTATVRLTEPVRGRFITADILEGEPRAGDQVR